MESQHRKKPTPAQMELILRYVNPYEDDYYIDYFNPSEAKRKRLESIISVPRGIPVIPSVGFCVMLKTLNQQTTTYMNVCHCEEIPRPQDDDIEAGTEGIVKLPVSVSAPHVEYEESGEMCYAFDIIVNTSFYQENVYTDRYFKEYVIALGRRGILNRYNVGISKGFCVMMSKTFRGTLYQPYIRRTPETEMYFRNYIAVLCDAEIEKRRCLESTSNAEMRNLDRNENVRKWIVENATHTEKKEECNVKCLLNAVAAGRGFVNSLHNNNAMCFQTNCDNIENQPPISVGASWRPETVFDSFSKEVDDYLEENKGCCINTPDIFSEAMRLSSAQDTQIFSFATNSANVFQSFQSSTLPNPVPSPANDISLCTTLPKQKSTMVELNSEQRTTLTPEENSFVTKSAKHHVFHPFQSPTLPNPVPSPANDISFCTTLPKQKSTMVELNSEQRMALTPEKNSFVTKSVNIKLKPFQYSTFPKSTPGPSNDTSSCTKPSTQKSVSNSAQRTTLSPEEDSSGTNSVNIKFLPFQCSTFPISIPGPSNDTSSCTKLPTQKSVLNSAQRTTLSPEKYPFGKNSVNIKFVPYKSATFLNSIPGPSNSTSSCLELPKQKSTMMKLKCKQRATLSPEENSLDRDSVDINFPHFLFYQNEVPDPATYYKMLPNRNTVNRKRALRMSPCSEDDSFDTYLIHKEAEPFFYTDILSKISVKKSDSSSLSTARNTETTNSVEYLAGPFIPNTSSLSTLRNTETTNSVEYLVGPSDPPVPVGLFSHFHNREDSTHDTFSLSSLRDVLISPDPTDESPTMSIFPNPESVLTNDPPNISSLRATLNSPEPIYGTPILKNKETPIPKDDSAMENCITEENPFPLPVKELPSFSFHLNPVLAYGTYASTGYTSLTSSNLGGDVPSLRNPDRNPISSSPIVNSTHDYPILYPPNFKLQPLKKPGSDILYYIPENIQPQTQSLPEPRIIDSSVAQMRLVELVEKYGSEVVLQDLIEMNDTYEEVYLYITTLSTCDYKEVNIYANFGRIVIFDKGMYCRDIILPIPALYKEGRAMFLNGTLMVILPKNVKREHKKGRANCLNGTFVAILPKHLEEE